MQSYPSAGPSGGAAGTAPGSATTLPIGEQTGVKPRPLELSVGVTETLTNNVNLDPSATARGDLVSVITPRLAINEKGARTSLLGFIEAPAALYVKTGSENNKVYPSVSLLGNADLWERVFFIDGSVLVSQQFLNPFGSQPADLSNATQNRYTSANYRVSPYVKGTTSGGNQYEVRNNNTWTNLSGAPISTNNAYYDEWLVKAASPVARVGWSFDYDWNNVKFNNQPPLITELTRASVLYQVDPNVRVSADGGYEDNRYTFADYRDAIYGVGMVWHPTPRTNLVANWEHRFFGSSYLVSFDHRTPLSAVGAQFSRNITSYPQQFLTLPATSNVPLLLNLILFSRFPDPAQRQQIVDALISERGLPTTLSGPVNLYTQQIYLQESGNVTLGLLGARNVVLLLGYYLRTEAITGAGNTLPPELAGLNDNTQKGVTLTWTHNLTPMLILTTTANYAQTTAIAPRAGKTDQGIVSMRVTTPLSPTTTVFAGARYQQLSSNLTNDYTEAAVFAGINYIFKIMGACRAYSHVCVAWPKSDGCQARGEANIGNIREARNGADALFGSNPEGCIPHSREAKPSFPRRREGTDTVIPAKAGIQCLASRVARPPAGACPRVGQSGAGGTTTVACEPSRT